MDEENSFDFIDCKPIETEINYNISSPRKFPIGLSRKSLNISKYKDQHSKHIRNSSKISYKGKIKPTKGKLKILQTPEEEFSIKQLVAKLSAQNVSKNYKGMQVMVNRDTGRTTLAINKDDKAISLEPWMFNKPKILMQPKENLFLLNKNSKNKNPSTKIEFSKKIFSKEPESEIFLLKEDTPNTEQIIKTLPSMYKVISWSEGNIDTVTDYISLSNELKNKYPKDLSIDEPELTLDIPDYMDGVENASLSCPMKRSTKICLSFDKVEKHIDELQEQTRTKYILYYRTPGFQGLPQPFKKVYYELSTSRANIQLYIPNTGIPFTVVGNWILSCHLGKRKKVRQEEDFVCLSATSKKLGCPANIAVAKIARFPDFDISSLSSACLNEALGEVTNAWDIHTTKVRYYLEYHVVEPSPSSHKGHSVQLFMDCSKFREPVDPRIMNRMKELAQKGLSSQKISEDVRNYVVNELFKGLENPPLDRRRYNPTRRDVLYAAFKGKEELKKQGKSMKQAQLGLAIEDLQRTISKITDDDCLENMKACVGHLQELLKKENCLFALTNLKKYLKAEYYMDPPQPPPVPRLKTTTKKKKKTETTEETGITFSIGKEFVLGDLTEEVQPSIPVEQLYITVPDITADVFNPSIEVEPEFGDMNRDLGDTLQETCQTGDTAEVYYFYPDGTCDIVPVNSLDDPVTMS